VLVSPCLTIVVLLFFSMRYFWRLDTKVICRLGLERMVIMIFFSPAPYLCYLHCVFQYCDHDRSLYNDWLIRHIERTAIIVAVQKTEKYVSIINDLITFWACRFFSHLLWRCWEWWELGLVHTTPQDNYTWRSRVHIYFWQAHWTIEGNSKRPPEI